MKSFLIKLISLCIICFALLWVFQSVVDYGLRLSDDKLYYNWNEIYHGRVNADLIFLGSSRALKQYDPSVFENKMKLSVFNLGDDGASFNIQKIKNKIYFNNNKPPKTIVINVDINSLAKADKLYNKKQYLPYYSLTNYNELSSIDKDITIEYLVPLYKYRKNLDLIKISLMSYFGHKRKNVKTYKGYHGSSQSWNGEFERRKKERNGNKFDYSHMNFDECSEFFKSLSLELKNENNTIFLVWAPEYYERQILEGEMLLKSKKMYKTFANTSEGVHYLDFTKDTICYSKKYFYDSYHLNKKGATVFSEQLADSIPKYFNEP
jgi:hypothetical protein